MRTLRNRFLNVLKSRTLRGEDIKGTPLYRVDVYPKNGVKSNSKISSLPVNRGDDRKIGNISNLSEISNL